MANKKLNNYRLLKTQALQLGAELFGVADITQEKHKFDLPFKAVEKLNYALSIGVGLSEGVLSTLEEGPNRIYFHHYRCANFLLDQIAFRLANFIQSKGFRSIPIPASQIVDWHKQTAHLSHKKIAYLAGLGWIGRNNLLVNRKVGCRFRLVTILTDMPLKTDTPTSADCGVCRACIKACPAQAISEGAEKFDHKKCFEKLKEFQKSGLVSQYICGVCVKVCPAREKA